MVSSNKELKLNKDDIQTIVNAFIKKPEISLCWRYNDGKVYLILGTDEVDHELEFRTDDTSRYLNINSLELISDLNLKREIKELLKLSYDYKSKKHIKMEIDYYLMELHEYILSDNKRMIHSTKEKLSELTLHLEKVGE